MQNTLSNECFMTHVTGKWTVCMMYVLMSLELQLISDWFITSITMIRLEHGMNGLMFISGIVSKN